MVSLVGLCGHVFFVLRNRLEFACAVCQPLMAHRSPELCTSMRPPASNPPSLHIAIFPHYWFLIQVKWLAQMWPLGGTVLHSDIFHIGACFSIVIFIGNLILQVDGCFWQNFLEKKMSISFFQCFPRTQIFLNIFSWLLMSKKNFV